MMLIGAVAMILLFTALMVYSIQYEKEHPCIEYKDVCQEQYTHSQMRMIGKTPVPQTVTDYKTVDCSQPHDRIIKQCTKRK